MNFVLSQTSFKDRGYKQKGNKKHENSAGARGGVVQCDHCWLLSWKREKEVETWRVGILQKRGASQRCSLRTSLRIPCWHLDLVWFDLAQNSRLDYKVIRLNCFKPEGFAIWESNDYFSVARLFLINFVCVSVGCQHRPINKLESLRIWHTGIVACNLVFFSAELETRSTITQFSFWIGFHWNTGSNYWGNSHPTVKDKP